jgi:protein O-mannosyl-transferase
MKSVVCLYELNTMPTMTAEQIRTQPQPDEGHTVNTSPSEPLVAGLRRKPWLLGLALIVGTLLLYGRVAHYDFLIFDDKPYVTQNIHVNTGLKLENVIWAFTAFHEGNWHPVTWLSHMADCQWFGVKSGPSHLINVVLHCLNILLLFWLLRLGTGAAGRSFVVAALFAVHPLNVETIAWVAERKSLLSAFFSLLTILAYGWYIRRPGWSRYVAIVVAFALALMSKPMAVSLPLVLLLLDYWPLRRFENLSARPKWTKLSLEKLPLLLMSAASSIVTIIAQRSGGAMADATVVPLFSVRLGNTIISYVAYLGKIVWPSNLSVFYPHPERAWPWPDVMAAAFILIAITAGVLRLRRERYLAVGWFWFLITLVPVIGLVQVGRQAMADRYVYVPCVGLFIIVAWGLCDLASAAAMPRAIPALAACGVILVLAAATNSYLPYWQNGVKLFTRAAEVASHPDYTIEEALGDAFSAAGQETEAYRHYGNTCTLVPNYPLCHYNMAGILFHRHQLRDALDQLEITLRLTNNKDIALSCLINSGEILMALGDSRTAQTRFAAALQIDPGNEMALRLQRLTFNPENAGH